MLSDDTQLLAVPKTHGCITDLPSCLHASVFLKPLSLYSCRLFSLSPSLLALQLTETFSLCCSEQGKDILWPIRLVSSFCPFLLSPSSSWIGLSIACSPQHPYFAGRNAGKVSNPNSLFPSGRQEQSVTTDVFHLNVNPAPADLWWNSKSWQCWKELLS